MLFPISAWAYLQVHLFKWYNQKHRFLGNGTVCSCESRYQELCPTGKWSGVFFALYLCLQNFQFSLSVLQALTPFQQVFLCVLIYNTLVYRLQCIHNLCFILNIKHLMVQILNTGSARFLVCIVKYKVIKGFTCVTCGSSVTLLTVCLLFTRVIFALAQMSQRCFFSCLHI